jgi:hypothetical protein
MRMLPDGSLHLKGSLLACALWRAAEPLVASARAVAVASGRLKTAWGKIRDVDAIIAKAADIAHALGGDGTPTAALGEEVQTAMQKKASAFLYADRPLDVGIVAGVATSELLSGTPDQSGWLIVDVWAAALWSALGFQPALVDEKREALRTAVLEKARTRSIAGAEAARTRLVVPDFGAVALAAGAEAELGEAIKAATAPTIEALRRNSALDREELDFLWWAQLHRSRLLNRPLASISPQPKRGTSSALWFARCTERGSTVPFPQLPAPRLRLPERPPRQQLPFSTRATASVPSTGSYLQSPAAWLVTLDPQPKRPWAHPSQQSSRASSPQIRTSRKWPWPASHFLSGLPLA